MENTDETKPARAFWEAIPEQQRHAHLANVWRTKCTSETTIVDYHGRLESGDLILAPVDAKPVVARSPVWLRDDEAVATGKALALLAASACGR